MVAFAYCMLFIINVKGGLLKQTKCSEFLYDESSKQGRSPASVLLQFKPET